MLIYHPSLDPFHCGFRTVAILRATGPTEVDKARILDFYLTFPAAMLSARLPQGSRRIRTLIESRSTRFSRVENPQRRFLTSKEIQTNVYRSLAGAGYLYQEALEENGELRLTDKPLPSELIQRIGIMAEADSEFIRYLFGVLGVLPLRGPDGLKARSGLLEYRYDAN